MQITITEKNAWENETFSYIIEVTEEILTILKDRISEYSNLKLDETSYNQNDVKTMNSKSSNSYMNRYDFYILPSQEDLEYYKEAILNKDVFYKGVGLNRI